MALGDPLGQDQISQYTNQASSAQFPWQQLGYNWNDKGDAIVKAYMSSFGRLPTQQEFDQATPIFQGPNGNAYVSSLAQQQQQLKQAPQQEAQLLGQIGPQINNLVSQQMQGQIKNLTDPNSPGYQAFAGNMNNLGITPSSGAFQAGLGSTLASDANQDISAALGSIGLPVISGFTQGQMAPFTQSVQQPYQLQNQGYDWQQFNAQAQMAKQLSEAGQPSGAMQDLGMAFNGLNAASNAARGAAAVGATYICTAMREHGILNETQVIELHDHLFKAFWKKPLKFIFYFLFGKTLVLLANRVCIEWELWKSRFYDDVIAEKDSVHAVNLYEQAFWDLFQNVKQRFSMVECHGF